MLKAKVLVLGSTGFVGKNIVDLLFNDFEIIQTTRDVNRIISGTIYFDITDRSTWKKVIFEQPDFIINCIGYGVVRDEIDVNLMYRVNYFETIDFYKFLSANSYSGNLIHIGTAFEYDLSEQLISENSTTAPRTHYGISKFLASNYLLNTFIIKSYIILRPFNMYGPYEETSKLLPTLISAQRDQIEAALSSGEQKRDFLFVGDLVNFIKELILSKDFTCLPKVVNVGSNSAISLKDLATVLFELLPIDKDLKYWKWGAIEQRKNEHVVFRNDSLLCKSLGLKITEIKSGLCKTINYYLKNDL